MSKNCRSYSHEFRGQMVEWVKAGKDPKDLAKEFSCHVKTIRHWVKLSYLL